MSRHRKAGNAPDGQVADQQVATANDPFPGADAGPTPDFDTSEPSTNGEPSADGARGSKRLPVTYTVIAVNLATGEREVVEELANSYRLRKWWAMAGPMARRIWKDFRIIQTRDVTDKMVASGKVVL